MSDLPSELRVLTGAFDWHGSDTHALKILQEAANRIEELEAANDAAEKSNRISENGNLWRFWSDKARDLATKNTALLNQLREGSQDEKR